MRRKYTRTFERYENNHGRRHPLDVKPKRELLKRATEPVGAEDLLTLDDYSYYGSVQIGQPAQSFFMIFDTVREFLCLSLSLSDLITLQGSADILVPATGCKTCGGHALYNPK